MTGQAEDPKERVEEGLDSENQGALVSIPSRNKRVMKENFGVPWSMSEPLEGCPEQQHDARINHPGHSNQSNNRKKMTLLEYSRKEEATQNLQRKMIKVTLD